MKQFPADTLPLCQRLRQNLEQIDQLFRSGDMETAWETKRGMEADVFTAETRLKDFHPPGGPRRLALPIPAAEILEAASLKSLWPEDMPEPLAFFLEEASNPLSPDLVERYCSWLGTSTADAFAFQSALADGAATVAGLKLRVSVKLLVLLIAGMGTVSRERSPARLEALRSEWNQMLEIAERTGGAACGNVADLLRHLLDNLDGTSAAQPVSTKDEDPSPTPERDHVR